MGRDRHSGVGLLRYICQRIAKAAIFAGRPGVRSGFAVILLALMVAMTGPGKAQTQLTPVDFKRVNALSGNTVAWAVLRKAVALGLSEAGLGEIADQSDSVDTIAAILALEDPEGRLISILAGAARGGQMAAANLQLVSSLGLDGARPMGIACLIYGNAPEERKLLADLVALSEAVRANCARQYARIRDYWLNAVAGFLRSPTTEGETAVEVELGPASGTLASARSVLIAGETVHEIAYFLRRSVRYSQPLVLRGTSCGVPAVDIDQANGQLVICYELLAELVPPIAASIGAQAR